MTEQQMLKTPSNFVSHVTKKETTVFTPNHVEQCNVESANNSLKNKKRKISQFTWETIMKMITKQEVVCIEKDVQHIKKATKMVLFFILNCTKCSKFCVGHNMNHPWSTKQLLTHQ